MSEAHSSMCETATLSNGLRIIRHPSSTDVVYCGYAINAGTRDEERNEYGLAHFVEHILFKGTEKRRAWHILNRMENVGGDLNAFTTKEETVVYATCMKKDFARAIELLTDIVFHSVFPEREIRGEAQVILDEIESYRDTPTELIFDDFEDILFAGQSLGHNILGTPHQVQSFCSADAIRFTSRYYHPSNVVLFVYGNIPMPRIEQWAMRLTADLPSGQFNRQSANPCVLSSVQNKPSTIIRHRHTHQSHVLTGCKAYSMDDCHRLGLCLLSNMLGGPGMNSRLNVVLREHLGLVYNVECNLTSYTDTGVFNIYFGCDPSDVDRCLESTFAELHRLCDSSLTPRQIAAAKKQLIGQSSVAADNFENTALSMAKSFLHRDIYEDNSVLFRRLEAIEPADLLEIARDLFHPERFTTLIYK